MSRRLVSVLCVLGAALATVLFGAACGTQRISVPTKDVALHTGAVLFHERCSGCHSLSAAAAFGSAQNVSTAQFNNGPNFNIRCERPAIRVLYAIENGGFSGAIMPPNIVVGNDAVDVAKFVATYSGRQAPIIPGNRPCQQKSIGSIPSPLSASSTTTTSTTTTSTSSSSHTSSSNSSKSSKHASSKKRP